MPTYPITRSELLDALLHLRAAAKLAKEQFGELHSDYPQSRLPHKIRELAGEVAALLEEDF